MLVNDTVVCNLQEVYRGDRTACSVEGLHFDTEYRARVKAFNRVGFSAYSSVVRVHTAQGSITRCIHHVGFCKPSQRRSWDLSQHLKGGRLVFLFLFRFSQTWLRYVWLMAWQIRLSVCRLWRACTLLRGFNFSGIFLHHIVAWPSGNSPTKITKIVQGITLSERVKQEGGGQTGESVISPPISCYLFITAGAIYTAGE